MRKTICICLYLSLLLINTACSTLKGRAEDYLEDGNYHQARLTLIEAIKKDKDDPELHQLKKIADNGYIKELLIAIRNRNMELHYDESINIAHEIYQIRKEGDVEENINGSTLEASEVKKTFPFYRRKINQYLASNYVIKAKKYYKDHFILYENFFTGSLKDINKKITSSGLSKCSLLYKKAKRQNLYFKEFSNSFCALFGSNLSHKIPSVDPQLYSSLSIDLNLTNNFDNGAFNQRIIESINNQFKESVWYHRASNKKASLKLGGIISYDLRKTQQMRVHEYTEKVPYTDYQLVKKTRTEHYTENKNFCSPRDASSNFNCGAALATNSDCICTERAISKSRQVEYEENEPITRYRDVAKTYDYLSEEVSFIGAGQLKGDILLNERSVPIYYNDKINKNWNFSKVDRPMIGLHSEDPYPNFNHTWEDNQVKQISSKIKRILTQQWQDKYCKDKISQSNYMKYAGNVFSCIKVEGRDSSVLRDWIKNFANMEIGEFSSVLNI